MAEKARQGWSNPRELPHFVRDKPRSEWFVGLASWLQEASMKSNHSRARAGLRQQKPAPNEVDSAAAVTRAEERARKRRQDERRETDRAFVALNLRDRMKMKSNRFETPGWILRLQRRHLRRP